MSTSADNSHRTPESGDDRPTEKPGIEEIQADIAQTREELGRTVDALSAKLDVKARAKGQVAATRQRAMVQLDTARARATVLGARAKDATTSDSGNLKPAVPAGAVALALVGVGVLLLWRRRNR
jgi:hypothetical protein